MTVFVNMTNPPPQVEAAGEVLVACLAFTSRGYAASQIHYPSAGPDAIHPVFIPVLRSARELGIIIIADAADLDVGDLQTLAMELRAQVPSRYRMAAGGLVIADEPDISDVGQPSDGLIAGGHDCNAIDLTCRIGIDLGS